MSTTRPPSTRGRTFTGPITTSNMTKTAIFAIERRVYIPKYERYEKRSARIKVHVPEGMEIENADVVTIQETRQLSKTKNFMIVTNHTKGLVYINGKIQKEKAEPSAKPKS
jgi:ribosomal protein S17